MKKNFPQGKFFTWRIPPKYALDHDSTLVCVIEMSDTSWLVAATVPGVDRRPLQKLPVNPHRLLDRLERWRKEAARAGRAIMRTVVAYESGRDGFWLARLLQGHEIEVYVNPDKGFSRD
jgi:transposase